MSEKLSIDAIDEKMAREAGQFFEDNPEKLKEAKEWYSGNGFESLVDALQVASESGYWLGILYVAYNRYESYCYDILCQMIASGWTPTPETEETVMVKAALEEGKRLSQLPNEEHSRPLSLRQWSLIFGVGKNKMSEIAHGNEYHFRQIGGNNGRKWTLRKSELPAEYLEKYRKAIK